VEIYSILLSIIGVNKLLLSNHSVNNKRSSVSKKLQATCSVSSSVELLKIGGGKIATSLSYLEIM